MLKRLLFPAAVMTALTSHAIVYECGQVNTSAGTCVITGWSGNQPTSGKLTLPTTYTVNGASLKVVGVAAHALDNLTTVTEITIPAGIVTIGNAPSSLPFPGVENFDNCPMLAAFKVDAANTVFASTGAGMLVDKKVNHLYRVAPAYAPANGELTMSSNILYIHTGAFNGVVNATQVTIPASVLNMGALPGFHTMANLNKFVVGATSTDYKVDNGALIDLDHKMLIAYPPARTIQNLTLGASATSIEPYAFAYTKHLKTVVVPSAVTEIGERAFYASSVTSVTLPTGLEWVGSRAFALSKLTSLTYPCPANYQSESVDICAGCKSLTSIAFTGTEVQINPGFARDCTALTTVTSSQKPKRASQGSFKNCTSLATFPFGSKLRLDADSVFYNTGFTQVVFGDEDASSYPWGKVVFGSCPNLTLIDMSKMGSQSDHSYPYLTSGAVADCPKLTEVRLPRSVMLQADKNGIGGSVFSSGCPVTNVVAQTFDTSSGVVNLVNTANATSASTYNCYLLTDGLGVLNSMHKANLSQLYSSTSTMHPTFYCNALTPFPNYAVSGAKYFVPAWGAKNYTAASNVREMYSLAIQDVSGKMQVTAKAAVTGVEITYVMFNGKYGGKPNAQGVINMNQDFSTVNSVEIQYTANGVKMTTTYDRSLFATQSVDKIGEANATTLYLFREGNSLVCNRTVTVTLYTLAGAKIARTCDGVLPLDGIDSGMYIAVATAADGTAIRLKLKL